MIRKINFHSVFVFFVLIFCINSAKGAFVANAGANGTICPGATYIIGGTPAASGGLAPYTYSWSPSAGLSNSSLSNPVASPSLTTTYTLTVTDDTGAVKNDVVTVTINSIRLVNAGKNKSLCSYDTSVVIGAQNNGSYPGITYSWEPSGTLNDTTLPNPTASPTQTTTYTMTATTPGCPSKTDFVTVTRIAVQVNAGNDTTILEGQTAELHGSGGYQYTWTPSTFLTDIYSSHPNAEPLDTIKYYLNGTDASGKCSSIDSVTVIVIPSSEVAFYNTFTPNGDGVNDTWYMGNIYKYPDNHLEIFNRYGILVFKIDSYLNDWDGKAFGKELPSGTYFYTMDLGDGSKKIKGTVTIVR